jgi:Tfp pilus assembly PilM family ATPase
LDLEGINFILRDFDVEVHLSSLDPKYTLVYNKKITSLKLAFICCMLSLPDVILPKIKCFGLSIERASLHAVELNEHKKAIRLAEIQLPPDMYTEGVLAHEDVFINLVKNLVSAGKFSTPYVAVTFPEVFAYTREYSLPIIPFDEIQEAISWHAKELFPFPEEEIYFDWKIREKIDKEYKTTVVAVQKKVLDPLVKALESAGLKPLRFEPDASALSRLLTIKSNEHALLIEINPRGSYVTLVEGEKALFTTVIPLAAEDTPEVYFNNINQTLMEITNYYRHKEILTNDSTSAVVTGEMANQNWVDHLSKLLGYPTRLLTSQMDHPRYNKAYAAVLEKIAPPLDENTINLLPISTQSMYDNDRNNAFYKTVLARICLITGFMASISFASYIGVTIEKQRYDSSVKTLRKFTDTERPNTQALLLLNAQAKNIVSLAPLRVTPKEKLNTIRGLLTDKITITQWEFDDSKQQYKLMGVAETRDALLLFKKSLEDSESFSRVDLPLGTLETPVQVPFVITFLIKS